MALMKKYGVWLALMFTLAATMWVSQQKETDELVVARDKNSVALIKADVEAAKQISPPVPTLVDYLLQRLPDHDVPKNIFTTLSTDNNPEINAEPAIAVPANPFVYAGKIIEDGALVVFLIDGEKSHAVKSGDVIEETWTVKTITPPTMTLKYIPLKIEMQMEIGANS